MSDADPPKPVDLSKLVHIDFTTIADPDPTDQAQKATVNNNPLLFPAFVYGEYAVCRRQMKAEVKRWIKHYDKHGDFPEPKMVPVPPNTLVIVSSGAASMLTYGASKKNLRWYFCLVDEFRMLVNSDTPLARADFHAKFEALAFRYPWVALTVVVEPWDFSIPLVMQRLDAVLSFWEPLDTLRYLDIHFRKLSLGELMLFFYEGTIRLWVDTPRGTVPEMLHAAIQQMRNASEEEVYARIMRRLHEIIDTDPKVQRREWLRSPGFLEAKLAQVREKNPDWYENMTVGVGFSDYLSEFERLYPHG
jgi:hypothetical protein